MIHRVIWMIVIFLILFYGLSTLSFAGSAYGWQSGNYYTWSNIGGTTNLNGFNFRTGSTWRTTIYPNGNMSGLDSNFNYWNYNHSTGFYWNTNGRMCFGKGEFRTCY